MLEMLHLESRLRDDGHGLNVHVGRGQQQALLRDRGRGRDAPAQEFAPDLLIGRHRLDSRVVLVGAHQIGAVGAGGAQHGVEVLEDAQRFLLALGRPGMRRALREHVRRDAIDEVLRHQSGGEDPSAGLHALREFDLARAELDREQRLHRARRVLVGHLASRAHPCLPIFPGDALPLAVGPACIGRDASWHILCSASAVLGRKLREQERPMTNRLRVGLVGALLVGAIWRSGCAGAELPEPDDHVRRAVRRGRPDRRPGAHSGGDDAGADRPDHRDREQGRWFGCHRRQLCGQGRARRLHAVRQFGRRYAEPALHPGALQRGRRLRHDRHDRRGAAAGSRRSTPSCRTSRWPSWWPMRRPIRTSSASAPPVPPPRRRSR